MGNKRSRLAHCRKTAGYSQDELAERLGVERSTVVRWESARSTPQPWVRPKLAAALDTTPDKLAGLLHGPDQQVNDPNHRAQHEFPHPSPSGSPVVATIGYPANPWAAHSTRDTVPIAGNVDEGEVDMPLDRRGLLRNGVTASLAATPLFGSERAVNSSRQPAHALTAVEIDDLVVHLREQWHLLVKTDNLLGPRHALASVRQQLAVLGDLLSATRGDARRTVARLAAQYAESASWLHEDAGELAQAQQLIRQAMEWAQEADDRAMLAWALFRRSSQAAGYGDGAQAISLAQAGLRSEPALPAPMRAALAQQHAHGCALDGDEPGSQRWLDDALSWATTDTAGDARQGHGSFCTETYLQLQRGHCWLRLNRPEWAVQVYETALPTLPATYRRDRGVALANFATACAAADEPARAAEIGSEALAIARSSGSMRTATKVAAVAERLPANSTLPSVAALFDELQGSTAR